MTIIVVAVIVVICTWHGLWDDEPWESEGY